MSVSPSSSTTSHVDSTQPKGVPSPSEESAQKADAVEEVRREALSGGSALSSPRPLSPERVTTPPPPLPDDDESSTEAKEGEGETNPTATVEPEETREKKSLGQRIKDWFKSEKGKKTMKIVAIVAATILVVVGLFSLCFSAAILIGGFGMGLFTITLISGKVALVGCGVITYYGIMKNKTETSPDSK